MSHQSIIRILHERGFHPYRLRRRHAMNEADHEAHVLFATDILEMLDEDPQMLNNRLHRRSALLPKRPHEHMELALLGPR